MLVLVACSLDSGDTAPEQPVPFPASNVVGSLHTCALKSGGEAWCWGNNTDEQLGDSQLIATVVRVPLRVRTSLKFVKLAAGQKHTCGIATDGLAYCWGSNVFSQLGDSSDVAHVTPKAVRGSLQFQDIAAGTAHTCALTATGDAYCWGIGTNGELGGGAFTSSRVPAKVAGGHSFQSVVAGYSHTCALASGTAWCWGANWDGQLGDGSTVQKSSVPVAVSGAIAFTSINTSNNHTCGVTATGAAWCWGRDDFGQLGSGSVTVMRTTPVAVNSALAFKAIAPGAQATCALATDESAWCWGYNGNAALGDATRINRLSPTAVVGGVKFKGLASYLHTCGEGTDGFVYCWGLNTTGQLGDGLFASRPGPAPVVSP